MAIRRWTDGAADGNWGTAGNWSGSAVPVNGDDVFIEESERNINAGLGQSAVALTSLNVAASFTGTLGTKDTPLAIGASVAHLGYQKFGGSAQGSTRLHVDFGATTPVTVTVSGSASSSEDSAYGLNPVRFRATHASSNAYIRSGLVSIADYPGETSTFGTVDVAGGTVSLGQSSNNAAVTLTTLNISGGNALAQSMPTTLNVEGGNLTTEGSGTMTTVNVRAGALVSNGTGTITTFNGIGGQADFTQSARSRTVTTMNIKKGFRLKFAPDTLTLTNKINADESSPVTVAVS